MTLEEYIADRLDKSHANGCWIWTGPHSKNKPVMRLRSDGHRQCSATRWFYTEKFGELPKSQSVFQSCGNDSCVNPDHLVIKPRGSRRRSYRKSDEEYSRRFWSRVNIGNQDECWEWQGGLSPYGYGRYCIGDSRKPGCHVQAHRFAYEDKVGPIPEGLVLDHLCANQRCVNPSHLEPVTFQENIRRGGEAHFEERQND